MATRILESKFVCYCRVVSDSSASLEYDPYDPYYDPYSSIGIVKKIFKNRLPSDKSSSNAISDGVLKSVNSFKMDLFNVILNNDVFPLKSIQENTDGSVSTILYNAVNDFRLGNKVSFKVKLETTLDENDFISPRIKIIYKRNNTIEETFIPLFEFD